MSLNIVETKDYTIISSLNREVQNLHAELEPNIFKPYSEERMMEFFKDVLSKENIHGLIAIYDNQRLIKECMSKYRSIKHEK